MAPPPKRKKTKEELEKERLAKEAAAKKKKKQKGQTFVGKAFDTVNKGMKSVADKVSKTKPSKTTRSEMDSLAAERMPKPAPSPSPTSVRAGVRDFDYARQPPNVQKAMEERARAAQADPNAAYRQSQEGIMRRHRAEQNQLDADEAIRNDYDQTQANAGMNAVDLAASIPIGMGIGRAIGGLAKTPIGQNVGHYIRGAYEGLHDLTGQSMRPVTNMVGDVAQGLSTPISRDMRYRIPGQVNYRHGAAPPPVQGPPEPPMPTYEGPNGAYTSDGTTLPGGFEGPTVVDYHVGTNYPVSARTPGNTPLSGGSTPNLPPSFPKVGSREPLGLVEYDAQLAQQAEQSRIAADQQAVASSRPRQIWQPKPPNQRYNSPIQLGQTREFFKVAPGEQAPMGTPANRTPYEAGQLYDQARWIGIPSREAAKIPQSNLPVRQYRRSIEYPSLAPPAAEPTLPRQFIPPTPPPNQLPPSEATTPKAPKKTTSSKPPAPKPSRTPAARERR